MLALIGWGGFAEQAVSPVSTVYPLPETIDSKAALYLGVSYCTAYGGLAWRARLAAGETLLVLAAAGGVGLAAVDVGRALGARVIAAAGGPEKCAIALRHGADAAIDYAAEDLRTGVRRLTSERGVDAVFDPIGGSMSEAALRTVATGGRLVVIGFASGALPRIEPNILLVKNVSVLGFNFGTYIGWSPADERERYEPEVRAALAQLFRWHVEEKIGPDAVTVYPLERFAEAQDALLGRRTVGKVLLHVGG